MFNSPMSQMAQQQMQVVELKFVETGTYNPQYNRTYTTEATNQTLNQLSEATLGGTRINAVALAGVAGTILRPQAEVNRQTDQINLVNGWATKRLRFIAQIHYPMMHGGKIIQYVSGYTNHMGVHGAGTARASIDPSMGLFFNNSILLQEITEQTPLGPRVMRRLTNASQILTGANWTHLGGMGASVSPVRLMRPEDLLTNRAGAMTYGAGQQMIDMRQSFGPARPYAKSRYSNGSASQYLARTMDGQIKALQQADYQDDASTIMGNASGIVREDTVAQDNFMAWLSQKGLLSGNGYVTWGELCHADPSVDHVAEFYIGGEAQQMQLEPQHQVGQTAEFHQATHETVFANILAQSLPAALLDCMITKAQFRATNRIAQSQIAMGQSPHTVVFEGLFGLTEIGIEQHAQRLMALMVNQILPDVSMNGMIDYEIHASVDVFGETRLRIAVGGQRPYDFVVPSFCDNLMAPIITTKVGALDALASDITFMTDNIHQAMVGNQVPANPISSPYGF